MRGEDGREEKKGEKEGERVDKGTQPLKYSLSRRKPTERE